MCTRDSVFCRHFGKGFDHPRLRKPPRAIARARLPLRVFSSRHMRVQRGVISYSPLSLSLSLSLSVCLLKRQLVFLILKSQKRPSTPPPPPLPWHCTRSSRGAAASPSSRSVPRPVDSSGMCTHNSVFGRCVGRGFDHPRRRKPSEGGRKGPFALACFQQEVVTGKQCSDAAGVCFSHSSAEMLGRRIVFLSRPAISAAVAGWAANKTLAWVCC